MPIPREVSTQLDANREAHRSMLVHVVFLHISVKRKAL